MAGRERKRFPGPPRRLARDPLRSQGPPQGPRSLVLPLPAELTGRRQLQQPSALAFILILQQPDGAVRPLLDLANALAHVPAVADLGAGAVQVDAEPPRAGPAAHQGVAPPLGEHAPPR